MILFLLLSENDLYSSFLEKTPFQKDSKGASALKENNTRS